MTSERDARLVALGAPGLPTGMGYELRYQSLGDGIAGLRVAVFDEEGHEQSTAQVIRLDSTDERFEDDLVKACTNVCNSAVRAIRVRDRLREWAD